MREIKALESFLPFAPPLMGDEEINEVADTLRSGWLTTGPKTERFEKEMAALVRAEEALAVNSCTAALHLGLCSLGIGENDGVITTPLTFTSTAHVIMHQKARPFFVDIDPQTGNIDPEKIALFLSSCRQDKNGLWREPTTNCPIKAILPVHYGGFPCDMNALWDIAAEYSLDILEDAAHAVGASYKGLPLGHTDLKPSKASHCLSLTAFSFYATKNMTTGEGGMLVGAKGPVMEKARILSMYGISDSRRIWGRYAPKGTWVYDVAELGFKYNMMDIQAALGLHQLRKLKSFIDIRAGHAAAYNKALEDLSQYAVCPLSKGDIGHAWHLYPLRLRLEHLNIDRDSFIERLRACNIGSSVLFIPLHFHSYYRSVLNYAEGSFPEAEHFFKSLVNLPLAPAHSRQRIEEAAAVVAALIKKHIK